MACRRSRRCAGPSVRPPSRPADAARRRSSSAALCGPRPWLSGPSAPSPGSVVCDVAATLRPPRAGATPHLDPAFPLAGFVLAAGVTVVVLVVALGVLAAGIAHQHRAHESPPAIVHVP